MPVSKKAIRRAARASKADRDAVERKVPVDQPTNPAGETFVLKVLAAKLKENKHGVYRGVTTLGEDGKKYWFRAPTDLQIFVKGAVVSVTGTVGTPFGDEDSPIYPINKPKDIRLVPKPEESKKSLKIQGASDDALCEALNELLKRFGLARVLQGLAEIHAE